MFRPARGQLARPAGDRGGKPYRCRPGITSVGIFHLPLLLPALGASAVLLYGTCHVSMAQPRNVLGGHLISALTGVSAYQLFGGAWWVIAVGVTLAIMAMAVTHTLHPPGGTTAFIAVYTGQDFGFILAPAGSGALFLIVVVILVNNLDGERKYPHYWF